MNVHVIGAGYVGLVTATGLADLGHRVVCFERDPDKLAKLRDGYLPIYEPGLEDLLHRNVAAGYLTFAHSDKLADLAPAEIYFIAVGTPTNPADDSADLTCVFEAASSIAQALKAQADALSGVVVVAIKSTVPVGTADRVRALFGEAGLGECVAVISNPEFLREGSAVTDFFHPDRIVLGEGGTNQDANAGALMSALYEDLTDVPIVYTTNRSAELIKYASNAHLALRISFANELARLCDSCDADIKDVTRGMGLDSRIGPAFLQAGLGWGGSCFPKDVRALLATGREFGIAMPITGTAIAGNEVQKRVLLHKATQHFDTLKGKRFVIWGLAFKPNTDDVRESPAIELVRDLAAAGATCVCYDPKAAETGRLALAGVPNVYIFNAEQKSALQVLSDGRFDALFICTDWLDFNILFAPEIAACTSVVFDGRNTRNPKAMAEAGITYYAIGLEGAAKTKAD